LKGCSMVATGNRREIDWHYWTNLTYVTLSQACALSLGIDPHSFDSDNRYYEFGPGANDRPGGGVSRITQIKTMEELAKRRQMLSQALSSQQHFSAPSVGMTPGKHVLLLEFARWLQQIGRTPIADGLLHAVATGAAPPSLAVPVPAPGEPTQMLRVGSDTATITNDLPPTTDMGWVKRARAEGQKIRQDHPQMSTNKISVCVHEYLTKNKIVGRGGRVPTPETIRRHALKDL
jgi:hypothetical protein